MIEPRDVVKKLEPCVHGGINTTITSLARTNKIIDLSVSINPLGPIRNMENIIRNIPLDVYPDLFATEARFTLGKNFGFKTKNIVIGNGSSELIQAICLAYLEEGDKVISFSPTFLEYKRSSQLMNAIYESIGLLESNGFQPDIKKFVKIVRERKPKVIFLCNPNNPTGNYLTEDDFKQILSVCKYTLIVLDEAYINFIENSWSSLPYIRNGNVVVLRSMTKDFALTGLRIGYIVAHEQICKQLYKVLPPWNVNTYAQQVIIDILSKKDHKDYLIKTKQIISSVKKYLTGELKKLHISYIPSAANFILIKLPNLKNKKELFLKYGILIRDCSSYGLNEYIRIAIRTKSEMELFLHAVQSIIENKKSYANR